MASGLGGSEGMGRDGEDMASAASAEGGGGGGGEGSVRRVLLSFLKSSSPPSVRIVARPASVPQCSS